MKAPHLLLAAGNPRRIKENLINVLDVAALDAIEREILANVAQLYTLGAVTTRLQFDKIIELGAKRFLVFIMQHTMSPARCDFQSMANIRLMSAITRK